VGGHLVRLLARDPGVAEVHVPLRRVVARWKGLEAVHLHVVDFRALDADADAWAGEQVFLCLGTTMKKAGSRDAFRTVDLDYTLEAAGLALQRGARDAFLVSSTGADPDSSVFYLRVKGETERALSDLPFRSVHMLRPSLLTGERTELRPGERLGQVVGSVLRPLMVGPLRRHRPVAAETVAGAMVALARDPGAGTHVHESEELAALAEAA
jgi:uncharacterized protein YbjT (DUF2867 family)